MQIELLDKITERMIDAVMSSYMPAIQKAQEQRVAELQSLKSYVRTEPDKVEEWLDKEIEKAKNINSGTVLKQMDTLRPS